MGKSYFHIGWKFTLNMSQELAIGNFLKSIKNYEKSGDKQGVAESMSSLGMVYTFLGQYRSALVAYSKSKDIHKQIEYQLGIMDCRLCISWLYFYQGRLDEALKLMENLEEYFIEIESYILCAVLNHFRGCTYLYKMDYNNANIHLKKSCEIFKKLNNNGYVWTLAWYTLSNIKSGGIDQKENIKLINKKIDNGWLEDIDFPEVHYTLFRIHDELGEASKANIHLDLAYNKLITQSKRIEKEEFRESFLQSRCHNELIDSWELINN